MKIVSLLPSSTEILFALGLVDQVVAVSHECDFPPEACAKPKITQARVNSVQTCAEIDRQVAGELHESGSLYNLNFDLLQELQPDLIFTQQLCDVCAVSFDYVKDAVRGMRFSPQVINLEPTCLADIPENIRTVGGLTGRREEAGKFIRSLEGRINQVRRLVSHLPAAPRTFLMEWLDPPYCGGHWNGELVRLAGGIDDIARVGKPSRRVEWREISEFDPEILVISCCGFSIDRTLQETPLLESNPIWRTLPAVKAGKVFVTDGNRYFSRPGPRIVDSLEMLAAMIHPELMYKLKIPKDAFRRLQVSI